MISIQTKIKYGSLILLICAICACSEKRSHKDENSKDTKKPSISLETVAVRKMSPSYQISVPGDLRPYEEANIFPKVQGFIQKIYVDRGSHVKRGQLLATLEAPEMNQQLLSDQSTQQKMESDYLFAKQAYDRLKDAAKTEGAVAEIELDRSKSIMESARSAYDASKAGVGRTSRMNDYLKITAPFNGVITERNFSSGALVGINATTPIFKIAQEDRLRLIVAVPEKHASSIRTGTKANFTVGTYPGRSFNAILSRSSELIDRDDRSITVEFDVDNAAKVLKGGEYAQVKLELKRTTSSYFVPSQSILQAQSGTYVMTFNNNIIKRVTVKEGIITEDQTEVFGGLSSDDRILKKPSEEIKDGKLK